MPLKQSLIQRALLNAVTLQWWQSIDNNNRDFILSHYAKLMGWPIKEVNPEMTEPHALMYLQMNFPSSIRVYEEENQLR